MNDSNKIPAQKYTILSKDQLKAIIASARASWSSPFWEVTNEALEFFAENIEAACAAANLGIVQQPGSRKAPRELLTEDARDALISDTCNRYPGMFAKTPYKALSKMSWAIECGCMKALEEKAAAEADALMLDGARWRCLMSLDSAPSGSPHVEALQALVRSALSEGRAMPTREEFEFLINTILALPQGERIAA